MLGTIAYQTKAQKFTFEFWEGDLLTAAYCRRRRLKLSAAFSRSSILFNAQHQSYRGAGEDLAVLRAADLGEAKKCVPPLHQAKAVGVLRM
ncbi:MAG: hypothetical protein U0Y68_06220 [Blastocatellia bacterium]